MRKKFDTDKSSATGMFKSDYCSRRCQMAAMKKDPEGYKAIKRSNLWILGGIIVFAVIGGLRNMKSDTETSNIEVSSEIDISDNAKNKSTADKQPAHENNITFDQGHNTTYPETDGNTINEGKSYIHDSIAHRQKFIRDSIAKRKQFIRDSVDRRIKFVQDSLAQIAKTKEIQERQFQQWIVNIRNTYINSFVPEGMPWELKRKDGNIKSMTRIGNTFDFTINKKVTLSDIGFDQWQIIQDKTDSDRRILALLTKDRKCALIFSDEWDISTSRYQYKLACLATQSGDNTDTKIFSFSAKCQKEIIEYYNNNAPKRDQYPE